MDNKLMLPTSHPRLQSGNRPLALLLSLTITWLLAGTCAQAAFHLWDVGEVYSSPDGSVQYVELTALSPGQNFLGSFGATITSLNSTGQNVFTFPSDLPGDTTSKTLIIGTANLSSIPGGLKPDYILPAGFVLPPVNGGSASVTFNPSGLAINFTALPTDGDLSWTRSGAGAILATNSPKNYQNQSNTIVPVQFSSSGVLGADFVASFRTATGTNGSPGPAYAVDRKDHLTDVTWIPFATLPGDGSTKSITNNLSAAPQRFFRLHVP